MEIALGAVRDAAQGLIYLHGKGMTHKNPAPAMLALNEHGVARLVTFRNIVPIDEPASLRGKLVSDPNYVAPEQLGGDKPIGPAASVYQLAALLFHLLAGSPPHEEEDAKATALAHFRKPFPSLKGKRPFLKNGVYDLVEQGTQRDPAQRPRRSTSWPRAWPSWPRARTPGKAAPRPVRAGDAAAGRNRPEPPHRRRFGKADSCAFAALQPRPQSSDERLGE